MLMPRRNFLGCFTISTVFSHAQTVVICSSCSSVLCQPTGGRARLTEGEHRFVHGVHLVLITLFKGVHTVGRIEHSTRCPYCLHSGYVSFRLSSEQLQM